MAQQNYFPKSSQVGQGGAQVLSGRASKVDMSGYVKGLENLATGIQEERKYQREAEAARAKRIQERLDSLNEDVKEIQIPTNIALGQKIFKKALDGDLAVNDAINEVMILKGIDNDAVSKIKNLKDKEIRQTTEDGKIIYKSGEEAAIDLMGGDVPEVLMEAYSDGGIDAYAGVVESLITEGSNPNLYPKGTNLADFEVDLISGAKKQFGTNKSVTKERLDDGGSYLKEVETLDYEKLKNYFGTIKNTKTVKDIVLNGLGLDYNNMSDEESQKIVDGYFDELLEKRKLEDTNFSSYKNPPQEKGGLNFNFGGGRGENERFYFEYQEKDVEPEPAVEGGKYVPRDSASDTNRVISIEAKGTNPYQDFRTGEGQEVMRSALVSIKLDKNGEPVSLILTDEEEVPYKENAFILDQEYGLTKENIKALYNQQQGNNQQSEEDDFSQYEVNE